METILIVKLLLAVFCLVFFNQFFSTIELSFISFDIKQEKHKRYEQKKICEKIIKNEKYFIAMVEFLKNILQFSVAAYIIYNLYRVNNSENVLLNTVITVLIFLFISIINVSLAELLPRKISIYYGEKIVMKYSYVILFFIGVFKPLIKVILFITGLFSSMIGLDNRKIDKKISIEEIKSIIQRGENQGIIKETEGNIIKSVIGFEEKSAENIMTARKDVFMIDKNEPMEKYIDRILDMKHSRIPVYEDEVDNIIGIMYIKDFLIEAYKRGFDKVDIVKLIREGLFVPDTIGINYLFKEMKNRKMHLALLIDEYGGFSGIVSMEDLLEELVGDMDDEFDDENSRDLIYDEKKQTYYAMGTLSIRELKNQLGLNIDVDSDEYDTLAGFLIDILGYLPTNTKIDPIRIDGYEFKIVKIQDNRIRKVVISRYEK